ncbi:hypothetical protein ACMA1I_04350 [Pontibacter sp. 13R65]|uniref:hypothetical protein n=1 Tax=Pontibacter sp. 13R65 TaxID=3127458 RepID=UPI00301CFA90
MVQVKETLSMLLICIIAVMLTSCDKENEVRPEADSMAGLFTEKQYNAFLERKSASFVGKINGKQFIWMQETGFSRGMGIYDAGPVRQRTHYLTSSLITAHQDKGSFSFYFPHYNFSSAEELKQVYAVGKKELGDQFDGFRLTMDIDGISYYTHSANQANMIELVKTEAFEDVSYRFDSPGQSTRLVDNQLRMWFRMKAELSSCSGCTSNEKVQMSGLLMVIVPNYEGEVE